MASFNASRRWLLLSLASAAAASGCVVVPAGRPRGGYGAPGPDVSDDGPVVMVAPPPARVEVIPVAPGPAYVWIGGYWTWNLGRHVWIGGQWAPGRPGHVWVPHAWQPRGRGWREVPGYWRGR